MRPTLFPLFFISLILTVGQASAQTTHTKIVHGDSKGNFNMKMEGEAFLLKELGAAIASDNGALKVLNVMPSAQRKPAYKDVDLQQDDVVVMANGKRLAGVKDLQGIYDGLKVGEEFKLGIKRNEEMRLVSLEKADPKDLPKLQMKIMRAGDGGDTELFPAVGVALKMKGKDIVISELLPGETAVQKEDVKVGDVLVSMNGKTFKSLGEYSDAFDNIKPGSSVAWVLRRAEKQHNVTFDRPQPRLMMMKQEGRKP